MVPPPPPADVVIIDAGSYYMRYGRLSTGDYTEIPNIVAKAKYPGAVPDGFDPTQEEMFPDTWYGDRAKKMRGVLSLGYPIQRGIIVNKVDMVKMWNFVYSSAGYSKTEAHPVFLTEPPLNPKSNREFMADTFFNEFGASKLYIGLQPVLALYDTARIEGVVLDCGDSVSTTVPVYGGFVLPHAIKRLDVAGRHLTKFLMVMLRECDEAIAVSTAEEDIVKDIKEQQCYVRGAPMANSNPAGIPEADQEMYGTTFGRTGDFILPDGRKILLHNIVCRCPEALFQPSFIGVEADGVSTMLYKTVLACDVDTRKTLYSNIVVTGGSSQFPNFLARLQADMKKSTAHLKDCTIAVTGPPDRKSMAWSGGEKVLQMDAFQALWLSKADWEADKDSVHTAFMTTEPTARHHFEDEA